MVDSTRSASTSIHTPSTFSASLDAAASKSSKRRSANSASASASDLSFFTSAASSFKPRPYTPNGIAPEPRSKPSQRGNDRALESLVVPASMDPHPTDNNVVFIRPPFTDFPNARQHPEGLSYSIMADNPEWFLDPADFLSQNNSNPDALSYPPHLEPPRGWCPAKKKDLKDRGAEGWPEGEEPRLRCTFCRRTYAGVNAKSMWRRHVFEKHKIAMSNRRDTLDKPRGRGSNKENPRLGPSKTREDVHDHILNLDVAPQTDPQPPTHKSRFRSLLPAEDVRRRHDRKLIKGSSMAAADSDSESDDDLADPQQHHYRPSTPLTPPLVASSDSNGSTSKPDRPPSSPQQPVVPLSPYDPLRTPSFRHSPPRLPLEQPWRFPSPSHPLHSRSRELSLSTLVRELNTPKTRVSLESPRGFNSPMFGSVARTSIFDTPDNSRKFLRPSPRVSVLKNKRQSPRLDVSPFGQSLITVSSRIRHDEWTADAAFASAGSDPFTIYTVTPLKSTQGKSGQRPPLSFGMSPAGAESPVLRSSKTLPSGAGLGIGLLEPFTLPCEVKHHPDPDSDFDITDVPGNEVEAKTYKAPAFPPWNDVDNDELCPPLKKRKTDMTP